MSDEPTRELLRAIPLETLRAFILAESERSSLRDVAEKSGTGRTTLHNFVYCSTTPHPRIRRLLALYYMREAGPAADAHACETLLSALPADRRADAVAELRAFLVEWRRTYGGVG
jgi:hypothetical protein